MLLVSCRYKPLRCEISHSTFLLSQRTSIIQKCTLTVPPNMSLPTPQEIAKWPAPNYTNPDTVASALIGFMVVGTSIMLPVVIGRVYFRLRHKCAFGMDDWVIIAAAVRVYRFSTFSSIIWKDAKSGSLFRYSAYPRHVSEYMEQNLARDIKSGM